MSTKCIGLALALGLLGGCVPANGPPAASAPASVPASVSNLPDACAPIAEVAQARTNVQSAQEVRVGYWPEASLCQMLVVNRRSGDTAVVTYVWYGLPGSRGAQVPGPEEQVTYQAQVASNGDISFTTHWGARIVYAENGSARYTARPGGATFVGYARRS